MAITVDVKEGVGEEDEGVLGLKRIQALEGDSSDEGRNSVLFEKFLNIIQRRDASQAEFTMDNIDASEMEDAGLTGQECDDKDADNDAEKGAGSGSARDGQDLVSDEDSGEKRDCDDGMKNCVSVNELGQPSVTVSLSSPSPTPLPSSSSSSSLPSPSPLSLPSQTTPTRLDSAHDPTRSNTPPLPPPPHSSPLGDE